MFERERDALTAGATITNYVTLLAVRRVHATSCFIQPATTEAAFESSDGCCALPPLQCAQPLRHEQGRGRCIDLLVPRRDFRGSLHPTPRSRTALHLRGLRWSCAERAVDLGRCQAFCYKRHVTDNLHNLHSAPSLCAFGSTFGHLSSECVGFPNCATARQVYISGVPH